MKKNDARSEQATKLRQQAEAVAQEKRAQSSVDLKTLSLEETQKILNELQVHQIELEMQNEELRRAQDEIEASHARYFDLYDLAPVGYLTLSEQGLILESNLTVAQMLGMERNLLAGQPMSRFIFRDDQDIFYIGRKQLFERQVPLTFELRMAGADGQPFWVQMKAKLAQGSDGAPVWRATLSDISESKRAEAGLQQLAAIVESSQDAIYSMTLEGIILSWNKSAENIYGYSAEQIKGKSVSVLFPPGPLDEVSQLIKRIRQGELIDHYETVRMRKDGSLIHVSMNISPTKDSTGRIAGVAAIARDITERKRAEETLRRYELLSNHIRDIILFISRDNERILEANAASNIYGYRRDELMTLTIQDLLPLDAKARTPDQMDETDSRGILFETVHRRKDGSTFPVEVSSVGATIGTNRMLVSVIRDITRRHETEQALRQSEKRYRSYIEVTGQLGWTTNPDGEVIEDIPSWRKFTGQNIEEVKGWGWTKALHSDDVKHATEAWNKAVATKSVYEVEYRIRRFDGVYRYFLAHGTPVFNEDGNVLEWVGTCIDITERKQIEDTQKFLGQGGLPASGGDFFNSLARYLAEKLEMDFVCIDRLLEEGLAARTEAVYFDGAFEDNLTYTLEDTPCGSVVREAICCFPEGVRHLYPKDEVLQEMVAESYLGTVLWSSKGQPIGLIALIGRHPLANPQQALAMLKTVAVRAAGELERREAEEALRQRSLELQQLSETLDLKVREQTAELTKTNEELRRISGKLLSAHEEERKRVGREIHDSLGSHLGAIKFKVENAIMKIEKNPMGTAELLASLIPLIQEGIEECRRIQMDLRPPILDDLGLLPTLSWFFRRFQTIYSTIRVEQEMDIAEEEVPNPLKIVVFRVIQEAMNNIAKYSQADLVRQFLRRLGDEMELVILDNGQGFNLREAFSPNRARKGLGLTSMKERVELSGGSFSIESAEGKGTVIRAVWPI